MFNTIIINNSPSLLSFNHLHHHCHHIITFFTLLSSIHPTIIVCWRSPLTLHHVFVIIIINIQSIIIYHAFNHSSLSSTLFSSIVHI